jgi:Fe-S cluster biogenesis protein NfuA
VNDDTSARDLRAVGERIEVLLDELRSSLDQRAWGRVEEVVGLVTHLYGGGLERMVDLVDDDALDRFAADDLVASLLVLHGLHPVSLTERVHRALHSVRPYMESHGGDVHVLAIDEHEATLRLRLMGSCDGCPSSAVTLEDAVRRAVEEAAPEIIDIVVVDDTPASAPAVDGPTILIEMSRKPVPAG